MRFKLFVYRALENIFFRLESLFGSLRNRFAYCRDCGRNRYSGPPCARH